MVLFVGLAIALAIGFGKAVEDAAEDTIESQIEARQDVGTAVCEVDETLNTMVAHVPVTNHSSDRSNYTINVTFESTATGRPQIDTAVAFVQALESGQSTTADASSFTAPPPEGFTCRVVDVFRLSDETGAPDVDPILPGG